MKLLIGMLSYNRLDFTKKVIESLYKNTDENDFELIIYDNGSNDGTPEYLDKLSKDFFNNYENRKITTIQSPVNVGVAGGLNRILEHRDSKQHFMKLDNDIIFKEGTDRDWVKKIKEIFDTNIIIKSAENIDCKIGAVCVKPYTWNEVEQKETNLIQEYPEHKVGKWTFQYNPEGVLGCSTVFRKEVFDFFKKFDEDFIYGYEESLMHVQMIKNGFLSFFNNNIARVYHIDPGGETQYIKWKHQVAHNNYQLYLKKYEELGGIVK